VKIEDEDVNKDLNFDARISDSEVKAKVPSPGAEEREAHNAMHCNATHCTFRSWCPPSVAGKVPDPQHLELKRGEEKQRIICRCAEREMRRYQEYKEESERIKLTFLNSCKGLPTATVRQGDPLTAGTKIRNKMITEGILSKVPTIEFDYSKASGKVRAAVSRLEKAMVDSGEAFVQDGQPEKMIDVSVDGVEMPMKPDVTMPEAPGPAAKGLAAKSQRTEIDNDVEMDTSELDMPDSFFVRFDTQSMGCTPVSWRKCSVPDEGDTVCDKIWVEEWRADEEKGREREVQQLVHVDESQLPIITASESQHGDVDKVEEAIGCDCSTIGGSRDQSLERQRSLVFAEDSARSSRLLKCSENMDYAVLIVSVGSMPADIEDKEFKMKFEDKEFKMKFDDKEVQVDEPGNVRPYQSKKRKFGSWRKSALKCAREEVRDQDAAEPITERGAVFRLEDANIYVEQYGEDFFGEGPRLEILKLRDKFASTFMLKQAVVISQHADDDKEGWFLHRRVSIDDNGWHEEIDRKYIDERVKPCGVGDGHALPTPGYKDINVKQICEHLRRSNKFRMHVEKKYCNKMQPSSFLNAWDGRHAAWIINRFQPRGNGKTPYFSMRGGNYSGLVVDFGENVLFKLVTDDEYDDRWLKELFVGKQVPVSLSSGKAEVTACAEGLIEGLYLGPGDYMRAEIWIQEVPKSSAAWVIKFKGKEKIADLFTKYLTRNEIIRHIAVLGFELKDAGDVPLVCNGLAISLVSVAAEKDADDGEVDITDGDAIAKIEVEMQLGGVLMTYADKFKVRRLDSAV